MRITRVSIDNYKSIKHIDFAPNKGLNAFIGANSVGKSNIFEAINLILGSTYPTFNNVKKEDHFLGKEENKIIIRLDFDDNNSLELNEYKEVINYRGQSEIKDGLFFNDNAYNCKSEVREQYCSACLGIDRKILNYMPSNRWSLMGRILQEINTRFEKEVYTQKSITKAKKVWLKEWLGLIKDRLLFSVQDDSGESIMKKFTDILCKETAAQLNKSPSELRVDLNLYDPWNFYKTLQLIVTEKDMDNMEFQASNLGMGVQASISVAILRAYSELHLANNSPIFIDEPEIYLHPQAQRNFYNILRKLSEDKFDSKNDLINEGVQVFYTTHSPNFLSAGRFDEIFIVRKCLEDGTYLKYGLPARFKEDLKNRIGKNTDEKTLMLFYLNAFENTGDTQKANEGFFAKKIILVEGPTEALLIPYFFQKAGFDYIKEGVSIVSCGGKNELDRFYRLYTEFGIPCYIIFDGDKHLEGTEDEEDNIKKNYSLLSLFGIEDCIYPNNIAHDKYLGFEDEIEKNLGYSTSKKSLDLFIQVKKKIEASEINIPTWVDPLVNQIKHLPEDNIQSILRIK